MYSYPKGSDFKRIDFDDGIEKAKLKGIEFDPLKLIY